MPGGSTVKSCAFFSDLSKFTEAFQSHQIGADHPVGDEKGSRREQACINHAPASTKADWAID